MYGTPAVLAGRIDEVVKERGATIARLQVCEAMAPLASVTVVLNVNVPVVFGEPETVSELPVLDPEDIARPSGNDPEAMDQV